MDELESAPLDPPEIPPGNPLKTVPAPDSAAQMHAPFVAPDSPEVRASDDFFTIFARQTPDPLPTPDSPSAPDSPQLPGAPQTPPQTPDSPQTPVPPEAPDSPPTTDSPPERGSAASSSLFGEADTFQNNRFGFVEPGTLSARTSPVKRTPEPITPKPRAIFITAALLVLTLLVWFAANRAGWLAPDPLQVARAQLLDLDQGHWHAAYDLFSPRYRAEVSFEVWRDVVLMHSRMFRTRELRFANDREWSGGAALDAHLVAESGDHYLARFTLIYAEGHWWVDDLHWGREPSIEGQVTI
jgi:hypothetical protein